MLSDQEKTYRKVYRESHKEQAKAYGRIYYAAHREEKKANMRAYSAAHKAERRVHDKVYYEAHKDKLKMTSGHGLTRNEKHLLAESVGYCCGLCGKHEPDLSKLHVDHCHRTGDVRGILCNDCNLGLGRFHDDIPTLQQAIHYLSTKRKQ